MIIRFGDAVRRWNGRRTAGRDERVCVVGPGTRFLSGITYYTYGISNRLAERRPVSTILLRQLLPRRLYPGSARVGEDLSHLRLSPRVRRFDGVDWFWLPSLFQALGLMISSPPSVVLVHWWTGVTLHTQLVLACAARLMGAKIIVELHEGQDPGERRYRFMARYVDRFAPRLFALSHAFVVHSEHDRELVVERYGLDRTRIEVIPLATLDHYHLGGRTREAPADACNLLYFGVIRPFKGVEDLVAAFDAIPSDEIDQWWLTVVGETWEGWNEPGERIARSRYWDRITFVNRYVRDEEVDGYFAGADVVVLPYHRSSSSGPLKVAMSYGLPVVVTEVGGLPEAAEPYGGAVMARPAEPESLLNAIEKAAGLRGTTYAAPHDWPATVERYDALIERVLAGADDAEERPG